MSLTDASGLSASDVLALTANNNDGTTLTDVDVPRRRADT